MDLFKGLENIVKFNEPMAKHTWFRLGGPARYFVEPTDKQELLEVVKRCRENAIEMYTLGRGSNLLVADEGIDGVVVHLTDNHFGKIDVDGQKVTAQAGASLSRLLQVCAREGLSGMECLVGIPGTVGGAIKINAGGRFGDIGNIARAVKLIDSSGYELERQRDDIYFGYRMTNIMAKYIVEAEFAMIKSEPEQVAKTIKQIWLLKKNSQPTDSRNAGCVFKNPRALSAGALIDKVGLKGTQIGGAVVSDRHANFIIAKDGTTSKDVISLIDLVQQKVAERFEIELELELEFWPRRQRISQDSQD